jgi:diguanylate cyclase (GGDEF)-like protein/PAS domain S-box-containing protein
VTAPPSRLAITRGEILSIALGLSLLAMVMVLSQAAFDLAWILVYAVAAACAVEMARNLRWFVSDDYPLFLAMSLAVVAGLQLVHVAVELGLLLGPHAHEAGDQIALATGLVLAGSMLVAPFTLGRRIRPSLWGAVIVTTTVLLTAAILLWRALPTLSDGAGATDFARVGDLVVAGTLLAAAVLTWQRRRLLEYQFLVAMLAALGVAALGWAIQIVLRSDDVTHLMSVLFIALIYVAITRNGLTRPTELLFSQMKEDRAQATRMRELTLEELRASERRYRTVFEQSPAALFVFDGDLNVTRCNGRFEELLGANSEGTPGTDLRQMGQPRLTAIVEAALGGEFGAYEGEVRLGTTDDVLWISARATPLFDVDERVYGGIGVIVDMTEGRRAEKLIERLAFHDALTGLANRDLLRDRLGQALVSSQRSDRMVALLHIDIDRFADLNHLLGHTGADEVLREVAARLQPIVREADTLARWGTDEFVAVLQDVKGSDGARRVATEISAALAAAWRREKHSFNVTASLGIALSPSDGEDIDLLLEHAMIAAQEAKARGGDSYQFYDRAMGHEVAERIEIEHELRRALQYGELVLHYQPQIELAHGEMIGAEALIRWRHPVRGLLSPASFLPVAESTGLIEDITVWAIGEACRQAAQWQADGHRPLRIAVNVSARDFKSGTVVDIVDSALASSGLAPRWLEIELTETAAIADTESTASQLQALRDRGVAIALDDFGTGYSSLTHLQALPITRVKIDRTFVSAMCKDDGAAAIVGSMIALIDSLGLEAIAEGVESADELSSLRRMGCPLGQGYLFSRPLPADEIIELPAMAVPVASRATAAR